MVEVIRSAVDRGRDALVFVGRLGGALRLRCLDCAYTPVCANCGTGLALGAAVLSCRVCGATADVPEVCPSCGGVMSERGWGHDRVARLLEKSDLGAPVVRMVRGTDISDRPTPAVVVGTLAAAHGMRDVGAVVVADLDQLLTRPDFRAAEYALQTLHELAGVVEPEGRFLVQTREPEHHVVQAFTRGSFRYFLDRELPFRKETGYPPFGAVVRVELDASLFEDLRRDLAAGGALVVGAVPRKGRLSALVRIAELDPVLDPLRRFTLEHPRVKIDVDPVDLS
jgi:primosomal protein N' (replication factor Y)